MGVALANKNKTLGQVQKHIAREQYDRAIKLLEQLVEDDPNDVRSLLKLGDVYVKKGDRDVAVDVYKKVAKQYSEQGFFMKAVAIYKQILKHQSKNVEALMQLAELYEHLGLSSEARQQYLLAESVLQDQGDTGAALALMQKQVELDPDNVAHRIKLAEAYSSQDNIAAATRQFSAAAEVLRRQNREEDFIKVAERLVYHDPNRPEILRDLARLYLARGDAKRALAKLQLCYNYQNNDVETLELLAQAFSELRQYAKTKTVYRGLVQVLDEKGLAGKAEEYRLLIRQLEEADRPGPAGSGPAISDFQDDAVAVGLGAGAPASFDHASVLPPPPMPHPGHPEPRHDVPHPGSEGLAGLSNGVHHDSPAPEYADYGALVPEASGGLDDVIIEPPEEAPFEAEMAGPPAPTEASVEQQIANLVRDAKVYQRYNLPAGALEQLQRALELDPDNVEVLCHMRDLFMAEGDTARAADIVAELVRVHFRNGDRDAAEQAKRQIAQLSPAHPLAIDAMVSGLPPAAEEHNQREDSLSFVITEDSGSFEIVDVAESGPVPELQAVHPEGVVPPGNGLPEPEFAPDDGPMGLIDDDEPIQPFTSDLLNEPLEDPAGDYANGIEPMRNGAGHHPYEAFVIDDDIGSDAQIAPEDPTTLGEPLGADGADPFSSNRHSIDTDLPDDPAEALGSPIGIRSDSETENEAEPVTQATNPGSEPVSAYDPVEAPEPFMSGGTPGENGFADVNLFGELVPFEGEPAFGHESAPADALEASAPDAPDRAGEFASAGEVAPGEDAQDRPTADAFSATADLFADADLFGDGRPGLDDGHDHAFDAEVLRNGLGDDHALDADVDPAHAGYVNGANGVAPAGGHEGEATAATDFPDLTDELAEVQFFLDVGDETGAQETLRELVDTHPNHPEVMALAMVLDVETQRGAKAPVEAGVPGSPLTSDDVSAAFDKALEETAPDDEPSEVQDAYDQGMAYMEIDRTAQAIEMFEKAAEWPSMAATAREMMVRCYAKMDQPGQAVAHFRDAEDHGVSGAAATHLKYLIGACYERAGDLPNALEWFEACAADDPGHHDVQQQVERVAVRVSEAIRKDGETDRRYKTSYL